jgi:hypothetical protein
VKTRGAVEVLCFAFAADVDTAAVLPALRRLVDDGLIRIHDLALLTRTPAGGLDLSDVDDVTGAWTPLLSANDLRLVAGSLEPGQQCIAVVWEQLWASALGTELESQGVRISLRAVLPPLAEFRRGEQ